ncbi:hypothetical protein CISIN_1g037680mg [Citrus sinensis]|uniref:Uncharacterized protein n=1 Tax=Citrus sinensis TaxID=2711 RepID=A0A067DXC4_CITSI|nr:hypothetical protein CISIN_1g037680mg [Citrus sinensis]
MMNMAYAISLECPAGMGLSYSNTKSDYNPNADKSTAQDSYTFPISWLERLPQYKTSFFNTLGVTHLYFRRGNAWVDDATGATDLFEHRWTTGLMHAFNSDQTHKGLFTNCDCVKV